MEDYPISETQLNLLRGKIVTLAAKDYFDLLAGFRKPTASCNLKELRSFFYSNWYKEICSCDPDFIMEAIERKAKKMVLKYTISKQKNSNRYYVHEVGSRIPIPGTLSSKTQALHTAAKLNDIDYKNYMRVRRRDGVKVD